MITLYQYKRAFGVPNMSPFCMKVETYLRMAGLEHEISEINDPRKCPKGKAPTIEDQGRTIPDSTFILEYLEETYHPDLDKDLSAEQKATAHAFARMLEERYYWALVYSRWVDERNADKIMKFWFGHLPPVARTVVPMMIGRQIRRDLHGQGLGRHSQEEIYRLGFRDIDAVTVALGNKEFFFGDAPSTLDAIVYAFIGNTIQSAVGSPLQDHAMNHTQLVSYCERMRMRYYQDL